MRNPIPAAEHGRGTELKEPNREDSGQSAAGSRITSRWQPTRGDALGPTAAIRAMEAPQEKATACSCTANRAGSAGSPLPATCPSIPLPGRSGDQPAGGILLFLGLRPTCQGRGAPARSDGGGGACWGIWGNGRGSSMAHGNRRPYWRASKSKNGTSLGAQREATDGPGRLLQREGGRLPHNQEVRKMPVALPGVWAMASNLLARLPCRGREGQHLPGPARAPRKDTPCPTTARHAGEDEGKRPGMAPVQVGPPRVGGRHHCSP